MITRSVTTQMQAALTSSTTRLIAFLEFGLDPVVRVHTGLGTRTLDGDQYIGLGELTKIGNVKENANTSANRLNLELKILDQAFLGQVLNTDMVGIDVFMHLVALDGNRRITASQMYFYEGEISNKEIIKGDLSKQIPYVLKITASDWYERWSRPPNAARLTDAAQQLLYPGDQFFDQVENLAAAPISDIPVAGAHGNGSAGGGHIGGGSGNIKFIAE